MTIHNITPAESYLESVANFVLKTYTENISDVKIIVPTSVICAELQEIFVRKSGVGAAILPSVMPLSSVSQESELVYKIPSDNIEAIGYIEQKLLLIEIIEQYEGLNFSLLQAAYLSDQLLRLFHEIEAGRVDISALPAIVEIDSALHWMLTAQFLTESYEKWHQKIRESGKMSLAGHQKLVLDIEARDSLRPTIIVGITGGSRNLEEFIAFLAESERGVVIPPPFDWSDAKDDLEPISPFYKISKLLEESSSRELRPSMVSGDLAKIHETPGDLSPTEICEHITAPSELEEAELVARIAVHSMANDGTVAIVSNNRDLINLTGINLQKYGLSMRNLRGESLLSSKPIEFILLLAGSMLLDDIEKFAALLKSPFLACDEANDFEIKHLRKVGANIPINHGQINPSHINASTYSLGDSLCHPRDSLCHPREGGDLGATNAPLGDYINDNIKLDPRFRGDDKSGGGNSDTNEWFEGLRVKLKPLYAFKEAQHKFILLLKTHMECAVAIAPLLFVGEDGLAACEFFRELIAAADNFGMVEAKTYPDLIKQLLAGAKYFPQTASRIVALSPQDAALLDFKTFIIADCTEGSFPYHSPPDPWMTSKMRQQIGLKLDEEAIGEAHYYFRLLAHKKRVYITSAQKTKGRENVASRFLVSMLAELERAGFEGALKPKYDWFGSYSLPAPPSDLSALPSDLIRGSQERREMRETLGSSPRVVFPPSISATSIELLLCNPYGFYAKKILGLSKLKDINMEASLADFGTLVHNIIALYTENYESERMDKAQYFLEVGVRAFDEFHEHHKMGNWRARLEAIAEDFVAFDEQRREDLAAVYPEISGSIVLTIGGKQVAVTAIADRIELSKSGELYIIDYKTGVAPSSKSVKSGMSPQLIVEAIIAAEGGFKGLPAVVASKLVYIKIESSRPYFKVTTIDLSEEELEKHKGGLINLLSRYLEGEAEFVATPNPLYEPKYNDYKHLARKLSLS